MDGAAVPYRYFPFAANVRQQRVRRRERCVEAFGVSLGGTTFSADLSGSSKYSNENFEGRSGEGFTSE